MGVEPRFEAVRSTLRKAGVAETDMDAAVDSVMRFVDDTYPLPKATEAGRETSQRSASVENHTAR